MWLAFLVLPRSASLCPSCWREQRGSEQGQEVVFLTFMVLLLGTSLTSPMLCCDSYLKRSAEFQMALNQYKVLDV